MMHKDCVFIIATITGLKSKSLFPYFLILKDITFAVLGAELMVSLLNSPGPAGWWGSEWKE
jgi:hypothetical protein